MGSDVRINLFKFGEELAGALNDTGLGSLKDAPWFVEELFYRLKRHYHGHDNSFDNAEEDTKLLLDYQSLESKTNSDDNATNL